MDKTIFEMILKLVGDGEYAVTCSCGNSSKVNKILDSHNGYLLLRCESNDCIFDLNANLVVKDENTCWYSHNGNSLKERWKSIKSK